MRERPGETEAEEALELLTPEGEPTGVYKARSAVHQDGDWHRSFHLWIVRPGGTVLLQRRSSRKDLEPGKVDVTVGGHYRAGETLAQVVREVEEEIGLFVRPEALTHVLTRRAERRYPEQTDRELQEVYALRHDAPLEDYHPDCREVAVLYEAPIPGFIALCRDGGHLPVSGFDCQGRVNNALLIPDDLIAQARDDMSEALEAIVRMGLA